MTLQEKYSSVLAVAYGGGAKNIVVSEKEGVLTVKCLAAESLKQKIWSAYEAIDPDMKAGDMVLDVEIDVAEPEEEIYTIKGGDSLSKIASHYKTTWQKIFEANKDTIKNPDLIHPGQKIRIPN